MDFLPLSTPSIAPRGRLAREVCRQLQQYGNDPAWRFTLPLAYTGTDFQTRVWRAMMAVKPGKPQSYGHLADKLGSSARAVGNACRRNPIPVVIPCHRVVARSGIGGFAGQTRGDMIDYKNWLLEHERGAR
jgi:methylated-DNA-[protein]-cysteine S-methyltransferase